MIVPALPPWLSADTVVSARWCKALLQGVTMLADQSRTVESKQGKDTEGGTPNATPSRIALQTAALYTKGSLLF